MKIFSVKTWDKIHLCQNKCVTLQSQTNDNYVANTAKI